MSLLHQFTHFFKQHDLLPPKAPLLLAVSGGIDSVVVCELCSQAGFPFAIAHCNFGLRGAESERDELFVSRLADKYGVEKFIHRFGTETFAENSGFPYRRQRVPCVTSGLASCGLKKVFPIPLLPIMRMTI